MKDIDPILRKKLSYDIPLKKNQEDQDYKVYIDDAVETFMFQKQALQIKLQHNIGQLSSKNIYLSSVLKQLIEEQYKNIQQQTNLTKEIVKSCIMIEDQLISLQALQKKTQILKAQVLAIAYNLNQKKQQQQEKNKLEDKPIQQEP